MKTLTAGVQNHARAVLLGGYTSVQYKILRYFRKCCFFFFVYSNLGQSELHIFFSLSSKAELTFCAGDIMAVFGDIDEDGFYYVSAACLCPCCSKLFSC